MNSSETYRGFEPVVYDDSVVLILGSFPSIKSRENNFYYGNPQNRFWRMLASIFDDEAPKTVEEKVEFCRKRKIALWDVVLESNLTGSSDTALSKTIIKLSDIENLIKKHASIRKILCNGALAYKLFIKNFDVNLPIEKLPSTSPANVRFDINEWIKSLKID